jgi:hypothetical protein
MSGATLAIFCIASVPAHAAGVSSRAWVSSSGIDSASCGVNAAPCRIFQYTHDNIVTAGGSIFVKDSAGYGPLTINKAISIINLGSGTATIVASSGDGIDVAAGPTDAVMIRGVVIDGSGTGANGINITNAANVAISDCTIKGFGAGIAIDPVATHVQFAINNTSSSNNRGIGISAAALRISIDDLA